MIGLIVLPEVAGSALSGLSASVAEANCAVGLGVAVLLMIAAVTAGGWVLLARRRQVREEPAVAEFSTQVQAALDARDRAGLQRIAPATPPPSVSPNAQLQRIAPATPPPSVSPNAQLQRIAPATPPPSVSPNAQLQRITAYRLHRGPLAAPRSMDEGSGS